MRRLKRGIFVFLSLVSSVRAEVVTPEQQTNREVVQNYVDFYVQQKKYNDAAGILKKHLAEDSDDRLRWKWLGQVYLLQKKSHLAADAFKRAGEWTEDSSFDKKFRLSLAGRGGYDSNVLLLSDNSLQTISRSNTDSAFFSLLGNARYQTAGEDALVQADLRPFLIAYPEEHAKRYDLVGTNVNLRWTPSGKIFYPSLFSQSNVTFLNTSGFEFYTASEALGFDLIYEPTTFARTVFSFPMRYQKFDNPPGTAAANDRTGLGVSPAVTQAFRFDSMMVSLGFNYDQVLTDGKDARVKAFRWPFVLATVLPLQVEGVVSSRYTYQMYNHQNSRRDHLFENQFSLRRLFFMSTNVTFSYGYIRNLSNQGASQYDRHIGSVELEYAIF